MAPNQYPPNTPPRYPGYSRLRKLSRLAIVYFLVLKAYSRRTQGELKENQRADQRADGIAQFLSGFPFDGPNTSGGRRGSLPCKTTHKRGRADVIRGARRGVLGDR